MPSMFPRRFIRVVVRGLMRLVASHAGLERTALRVLGRFPQLRYRVRRLLLDRAAAPAVQSPDQLESAAAAAVYFDLRNEISRRRAR